MFRNIEFGKIAEDLAVDFLKSKHYKILKRNLRSRSSEVDIVAKENDTICVMEVKARLSTRSGLPHEAINYSKQRKIS